MTRILIADDEPLARERLKMLLVGQEGFEVVGECHDGPSTIDAIRRSKPDLVFLDVQMPGANGFEVVSALGEEELPLFVFVTAFDKYALKAFDVHALDYLLKPFDRDRFLQALARARQQLERPSNGDLRSRLLALVRIWSPHRNASNASSSSQGAASSSFAPTRSTGSKRPAITSSSTSAPRRTCCARR